ncbi:alpha/beta fold hydrolase [Methanoplanus endosymbiosus]|uniref:Alpha/beta hydrolase n=1 Tax=Methanoplanus endosymbiosus TaxID=33865 RepID=A0A9E7PLN4_9EURY|nr:alpha/beta hydrolase [Methanoplanus endosymbiosus]UUX92434.1 alpha/beta hydrolase [Methanoplanus endosymbiosus]
MNTSPTGNTFMDESELKKINANGIDIAYREFGSGEPLLMITGYSATMDMWSTAFLSELSRNYRVIVFDNRGTGYSSYDDRYFTIPLFADDSKALLEALGVSEAHILGWSMGTNIALEMAIKYPEILKSLILYAADCGGKEALMAGPDIYEMLADTSGTDQERGMRLLGLLFPERWFEEHPDIMSYFPVVTETISPEVVAMQYKAMEIWNGADSKLHEIDNPVLIITGTEDILTPPENSVMIAEKISGSWLIRLKDSGHGAMYQYPENMASAVKLFTDSEVSHP